MVDYFAWLGELPAAPADVLADPAGRSGPGEPHAPAHRPLLRRRPRPAPRSEPADTR